MNSEYYLIGEKKISELIHDLLLKKIKVARIVLEPKIYEENIILPSGFILEGFNKKSTKIIIDEYIYLENNSHIKNLTIEYSNFNSLNNLELFKLNTDDYKLSENIDYYNIELENVDIIIYNFITGTIINLDKGNLKLKNVNITNIINDKIDDEIFDICLLFKLGFFTKLTLDNCNINYESMINSTYLFYSQLSKININNSNIILKSKLNLKYNLIFYSNYSHITIDNSNIENRILENTILKIDSPNEIITSSCISNLEIKNKVLIIKKLVKDCLENKIILFLAGIRIDKKNYIFNNFQEDNDYIKINLHLLGNTENLDYKFNINIDYLFSININNSKLVENSSDLWKNQFINSSYLINLQNVSFYNNNFIGITNFINNQENILDCKNNTLQIEKLKINNYDNLKLDKIFSYKDGYSLFPKDNIGFQSIDFTFGDKDKSSKGSFGFNTGFNNNLLNEYCFSSGLNNECAALNSSSIGQNLKNNTMNGLSIGKYNENNCYDRIFAVGNGSEEKREDIFFITDEGNMYIKNRSESKIISDGYLNIEEGNIKCAKNISTDNLVINCSLNGKKNNNISILNIDGKIITTVRLNLEDFIYPINVGEIISKKNGETSIIQISDKNGLIYKSEIVCIKKPNKGDIRFLLSLDSKIVKGTTPEKNYLFTNEGQIDIGSSHNWERGKKINEIDKFSFDYNYEKNNYSLYLAREIGTNLEKENNELNLTGKFLIRLIGTEIF